MTKRIWTGIAASLIIGGSTFYVFEQWRSKVQAGARAKAEYEADQQRIKEEIANLGAKYNAVSDWRAGLRSDSVYSATLQNRLVRTDGRPILFLGELHDIANGEASMRCVFDSHGEAEITFVLDCTQEAADYAIQQRPRPRLGNYFAVVAQIGSTAKLELQSKEGRQDEQDDMFQANGRCLDLVSLANYDDFLELLGLSDFKK